MDVIPTSCSIDIRPIAENTAGATFGVSWSLNLALKVWHPELADLEGLMANKLMRHEDEAFLYNARHYFDFVEYLIDDVLAEEIRRLNRSIGRLLSFVIITTLLTTVIPLMLVKSHLLVSLPQHLSS